MRLYSKIQQTDRFTNCENYFPQFQRQGSQSSRCKKICCLARACFMCLGRQLVLYTCGIQAKKIKKNNLSNLVTLLCLFYKSILSIQTPQGPRFFLPSLGKLILRCGQKHLGHNNAFVPNCLCSQSSQYVMGIITHLSQHHYH